MRAFTIASLGVLFAGCAGSAQRTAPVGPADVAARVIEEQGLERHEIQSRVAVDVGERQLEGLEATPAATSD